MHRGRRAALLAETLQRTEEDPVSKVEPLAAARHGPRWGVSWRKAGDDDLPGEEGFLIEAKLRLSRKEAASFVLFYGGAIDMGRELFETSDSEQTAEHMAGRILARTVEAKLPQPQPGPAALYRNSAADEWIDDD
jgi:hypothetical protein